MANNPVALVTGASRGIGKAVAEELAAINYDIVISYRSTDDNALEVKKSIESYSVSCLLFKGDIGNTDDRNALVEFTKESFGRCDLLVNNAGVAPSKRTDLLETTEESFDHIMNINLKGPYFLTQMVAGWMIQQRQQYTDRQFRIVNIGSISAFTSSPARGEYCISKAGMAMMTKLFADRLAEYEIGVFEVQPGVIATDMTSVVTEKYDKLIAEGLTPLKRWGQPEDVAHAVAAVAEGRLDFATGQVLHVDGGFHLRRL
jgi:NAD(P)-dependent dehydrogenase (short-subunit alcohol dehydrogenase family)